MIALRPQTLPIAMKRRIFPVMLLLLSLSGVGAAHAQAQWRELPPEDRRQMRQQMRDHWQQEREMRRDEPPIRRWQEVPNEDRRRLRDDLREHRHWEGADRAERPERGWRRRD